MNVRAGGKDSLWKLCIGLAIACGVLVFAAGFLHRNAVASAIDAQQTKSAAYVHGKLAAAVGIDKPTKQLGELAAAELKKDAEIPAGIDVRIYALDGTPVFSSGRTSAGDRAAITSAAAGGVSRVISGSDMTVYAPIENKGGKPIAVAAVVRDIDSVRADASGPLDALRLPLVAIGVMLLIAGLVLMVRGGSTQAVAAPPVGADPKEKTTKAEPAQRRVSGFDPVPVTAVSERAPIAAEPAELEPTPVPDPAPAAAADADVPSRSRLSRRIGRKTAKDPAQQSAAEVAREPDPTPKVKKALFARSKAAPEAVPVASSEEGEAPMTADREAAIRRLLEDQLEQLRTKMQTQEEAAVMATRQLEEALSAATRRAQEAEARSGAPSDAPTSIGPAERDTIDRLRGLEAELQQTKTAAAEAMARADELQRAIDASPQADPAAPGADAVASELTETRARLTGAERQIEEAQRLAAEADQRAASIESVRGELEVRVAQLGAKAGELEQKATELEVRLQEANAGGDAVRAEIASLTAALAAANARVDELESARPAGPSTEDMEGSSTEIARLRAELASQLERAQSAEDRVETLEADVLAAAHGVAALTDAPVEDSFGHEQEANASTVTASEELETTPPPQAQTGWSAPEPEQQIATEGGDGFSEVFAAAFGNEDVPAEQRDARDADVPDRTEETSTVEPATAVRLPGAPSENDRYGDVWSQPSGSTQSDEPAAHPAPAVASSLDEEPSSPVDEQATPGDEPATEGDTMSVEDDLWALRARLARAADDHENHDAANEGPRWA